MKKRIRNGIIVSIATLSMLFSNVAWAEGEDIQPLNPAGAEDIQALNTEPEDIQALNTEPEDIQALNTEPEDIQALNTAEPEDIQPLNTEQAESTQLSETTGGGEDTPASEVGETVSAAPPVAVDETRIENLLDLDASRVASSGVNRFAPFFISLQLKEGMEGYQIQSLTYRHSSLPDKEIVLSMVQQQQGREFTGLMDMDESIAAGLWNLESIHVVAPDQRAYTVARGAGEEEKFSKFAFTLVENEVTDPSSESALNSQPAYIESSEISPSNTPVAVPESSQVSGQASSPGAEPTVNPAKPSAISPENGSESENTASETASAGGNIAPDTGDPGQGILIWTVVLLGAGITVVALSGKKRHSKRF